MTVNDLLEELQEYILLGYGDKPVYLMNLNIQEHVEADEVSPLSDGSGVEIR
jgi:hypothetical protein